MQSAFHLVYHVDNLDKARTFYGETLGCAEGRSTETWVDFDFFGHQISLHLGEPFKVTNSGKVGEHMVPMPHLGLVLAYDDWKRVSEKLIEAKVRFILEPQVRFEGQAGEQWIMFFADPAGNPIEVKGFKDLTGVFNA